jgi:hypothetical protein
VTSIVRPARFNFRNRANQARDTATQGVIEAAERAFEECAEDADRLCREARERIQSERMREGER